MKRNYFSCHLSSLSENCTFFWICCPSHSLTFEEDEFFHQCLNALGIHVPAKGLCYIGDPPSVPGDTSSLWNAGLEGDAPGAQSRWAPTPSHHPVPIPETPKQQKPDLAFVIYTWFFTFSLCKPFLTGKSAAWTRKKKGKSGYWLVLFLLFQQGFQWSHSKFRLAVQGSFVVYFN